MPMYTSEEQLLRNRQPRGSGEMLGAMLGGGGDARRQELFMRGAKEAATTQDVMAQANIRRSQMIARDALQKKARENGVPEELLQSILASDNPGQYEERREQMLKGDLLKRAEDLATAPGEIDYNRINALKMAGAAEPTQFMKALGQGEISRNVYRTDSPVETTPIGYADIAQKRAQATAEYASARERDAQAARAHAGIGADKAGNYEIREDQHGNQIRVNKLDPTDTKPLTMAGELVGSKPPAAQNHPFSEAEMKNLGIDDATHADLFQKFKARNPGKSDSEVYNDMRASLDRVKSAAPSLDESGASSTLQTEFSDQLRAQPVMADAGNQPPPRSPPAAGFMDMLTGGANPIGTANAAAPKQPSAPTKTGRTASNKSGKVLYHYSDDSWRDQ